VKAKEVVRLQNQRGPGFGAFKPRNEMKVVAPATMTAPTVAVIGKGKVQCNVCGQTIHPKIVQTIKSLGITGDVPCFSCNEGTWTVPS
jgi:hypothetical protein